ncbi:Serine/threonine kinase [Umbelopsis nana]
MADNAAKLQELKLKIDQNVYMRDKAIQLRQMLKDRNAQLQCDTQIKESQKYIDYFSEEMMKLQNRSDFEKSSPVNTPQSPTSSVPPRKSSKLTANEGGEKKRETNLDLLKSDTPINKAKVSIKLHELEYKLDVEKKVQIGIRKLASTFERDPSIVDRRRIAEVQSQLYESKEKIKLLNKAVRKYKNLYIGEEDEDEGEEIETQPAQRGQPGMRRPVTGKVRLNILEARELAHAPTRTFKAPETLVVVKIDGNVCFRSRPSRSDHWNDQCETHVDKASEVEVTIYDQSGERSVPIGVLWLKISDIAEGLRRQKIMQDNGPGWVSAEVAQQQQYPQLPSAGSQYYGQNQMPALKPDIASGDMPSTPSASQEGIEAWFDVEPVGHIRLQLNFVRENATRRPLDKLGRAGAVRQRKEEVHEMNGHTFVAKRFYNIMRCALCGEFMVNSGYQCEDCELSCHKKCYTKVVTKCISKSSAESDSDEDKLNHRIPHRFEPNTNIGANWCCHCGYMLPIGMRGSKKCTECGISCHSKCAHLVPDFCGMSMEMANQMLQEMRAANKRKTPQGSTNKANASSWDRPTSTGSTSSTADVTNLMGKMYMDDEQALPPPSPGPVLTTGYRPDTSPNMRPMPPLPPSPGPYGRPQPTFDPRMNMPHPQPPPHGTPNRYAPIPNSTMIGRPPGSPVASPKMPQQTFPQPYSQPYTPTQPGYTPQRPHPPQHEIPSRVQAHPPQLPPAQMRRKYGLDDFKFLAVMLAEENTSRQLYAIKVLKKRFIIDNDEIESTRSEKRVFLAANMERHPFLVGLHSCFQTESRIYFVMEYVSGGDLMLHIQREQFSERRAKFYACEVLLALEYLHKQDIVYRDLKLDNIMLTLDGHIKMADYGLCKENMGFGATTSTFCGTPESMAPEILLEQRYGRAVDWWAYGVLIYEMLLGQSPFRGEDDDEIFDAILEDEILYPINMSRDSVSICQKLLTRDPEKRLGSGRSDAQEIKAHPFFAGVNWDDMLQKRVPPPFYPKITGPADTSNFDEEFTREMPVLTPINSTLHRAEQQEFGNFSYVAEWIGKA